MLRQGFLSYLVASTCSEEISARRQRREAEGEIGAPPRRHADAWSRNDALVVWRIRFSINELSPPLSTADEGLGAEMSQGEQSVSLV
jgi:hypothetical protein